MIADTLGRPFRDIRISVTDRCNFRCPYCMPAEIFGERYEFLPKAELLTFEEMERVARIFVGLGAQKVRMTGGEPLVRNQVERLVALLAAIPGVDDLTMTTNGYLLPQKADALKEAGLGRVTVSLDSLDDEVFRVMNGRGFGTAKVLQGIEAAENAGFSPIKINAVVRRGMNEDSIVELARYARERGHIMRFIEYMDVGTLNGWRMDDVVPAEEIVAAIDAEMPLEPVESAYSLQRRGGGAVPVPGRRRRDWRDRLGHAALLRRLHSPQALARGLDLYLPVLGQGHGPARPDQERRDGRGAGGHRHRRVARPHRPLLRGQDGHDGPPREGGDVPHRRVTSSVIPAEAVHPHPRIEYGASSGQAPNPLPSRERVGSPLHARYSVV